MKNYFLVENKKIFFQKFGDGPSIILLHGISNSNCHTDVSKNFPFMSHWEFREMFELGGSQYARPDVGLAGGITHVKKIASIAESYHSAIVTHNYLGPVITAAGSYR